MAAILSRPQCVNNLNVSDLLRSVAQVSWKGALSTSVRWMHLMKLTTLQMAWNTKSRVVMMPTLLLPAAPQVVVMTTYGATNDEKVGIITIISFQWNILQIVQHLGALSAWITSQFRRSSVWNRTFANVWRWPWESVEGRRVPVLSSHDLYLILVPNPIRNAMYL